MNQSRFFPVLVFAGTMLVYVCMPALLSAFLFRGGLILLVAGVGFVRRDGKRASRGRLLWRSLVAWSPVLPAFIIAVVSLEKSLPLEEGRGRTAPRGPRGLCPPAAVRRVSTRHCPDAARGA